MRTSSPRRAVHRLPWQCRPGRKLGPGRGHSVWTQFGLVCGHSVRTQFGLVRSDSVWTHLATD